MKHLILLFLSFTVLIPVSNAQFGKLIKKAKDIAVDGGAISQEDAGLGLKEALQFGVDEAVQQLSKEKGYFESPYRILLPEEAQNVVAKLKIVPGFENLESDLISKMNEAAEISAKKATPIFVDAITAITFKDAMEILSGENNAATQYLESTSRSNLYGAFMPLIQKSLDEVNIRTIWRNAVTAYNKIPFVSKSNPELDDHVNNKALDGLFSLIEVKESGIRNNVDERTTDLLRKVFK